MQVVSLTRDLFYSYFHACFGEVSFLCFVNIVFVSCYVVVLFIMREDEVVSDEGAENC